MDRNKGSRTARLLMRARALEIADDQLTLQKRLPEQLAGETKFI